MEKWRVLVGLILMLRMGSADDIGGLVRMACVPCLCSDGKLLVTFCCVYALDIYWCGIVW